MANVDYDFWVYHKQSLDRCLAYWRDAALREADEVSENEAAYDLLAHAGFMMRIGKDDSTPPEVLSFPLKDRLRVVSTACDHIGNFALPNQLKQYLGIDALEIEEIAEFEQILLQRDELDVVLDLCLGMVRDVVEQDDFLLAKLASAVSVAAELDEALLSRPDIMAVASRILVGTRPDSWLHGRPTASWYAQARQWDAELASADLTDLAQVLLSDKVAPAFRLPAWTFDTDSVISTAAVDRPTPEQG